jgi:lipoate-protein ligase A
MAVDEMLMQWAAATGGCCWRFYRWQEPTLSLGYFQRYEDRRRHPGSADLPAVRRISGGGAIVHDVELTYSFALPMGTFPTQRALLYEIIHLSLIDVLSDAGVTAYLHKGAAEANPKRQPFLCFQRRAPGDVLVGQAKIAGSAQRRSSGAVLQHGSVLLERCPATPELAGLNNLVETPVEKDQLIQAWLERLQRRLALRWAPEPLSDQQRRQAASLAEAKFGTDRWTRRRGR